MNYATLSASKSQLCGQEMRHRVLINCMVSEMRYRGLIIGQPSVHVCCQKKLKSGIIP